MNANSVRMSMAKWFSAFFYMTMQWRPIQMIIRMAMRFKPILIVVAVLFIVNIVMGFIGGLIPSLGNTWLDWLVTAFVNAAIFLWIWNYLKRKF